MKKLTRKTTSRHREAATLGRELSDGIIPSIMGHYSNREMTPADDEIRKLWGGDFDALTRAKVPADLLHRIDENHGEILILAEDQAFIAGLIAGMSIRNGGQQ